MSIGKRKRFVWAVCIFLGAAVSAGWYFLAPSQARAQARLGQCECASPIRLPTTDSVSLWHCVCGDLSCAVTSAGWSSGQPSLACK